MLPDRVDAWLGDPWDDAKELASPYQGDLRTAAVSKDVGRVQNNYPELLDPA